MSSWTEEKRKDGTDILVLKNAELEVWFSTLGASILKILVKDRDGNIRDVVMGYETMEDYPKYRAYLGAVVGRTANRIREGRFTLNGREYQLPVNNGPNCNHGGTDGFSFRNFRYELHQDSIVFTLHSPDGEEGYPGNMDFQVTYSLHDSTLILHYEARCDEDTLINITNHSYFNLSGHPCCIGDHLARIDADSYGATDQNGLVTGEKIRVEGTAFDYRQEKPLKDVLESQEQQIELGYGLDHSFLLNTGKDAVILYSPQSGIEMKVSTTMPQAQLYTANYFENWPGKDETVLSRQCSVAVETQYNPDDVHLNPETSPTILKKGQKFDERTSFEFGIRE